MMNTYYEITGRIDGETEVMFGSFDRADCVYELDSERDYWRGQGYKSLQITRRETDESPDPEVYGLLDANRVRELLLIACRQLKDYSSNELAIDPETGEDFIIDVVIESLLRGDK